MKGWCRMHVRKFQTTEMYDVEIAWTYSETKFRLTVWMTGLPVTDNNSPQCDLRTGVRKFSNRYMKYVTIGVWHTNVRSYITVRRHVSTSSSIHIQQCSLIERMRIGIFLRNPVSSSTSHIHERTFVTPCSPQIDKRKPKSMSHHSILPDMELTNARS